MRRCLIVLLAVLLGSGAFAGALPAHAAIVTFYVQGSFDDGGTFSGTFQLDQTNGTMPVFDITSTRGSTFGGFAYECSNPGPCGDVHTTPPSCGMIQFSFATNQSQLVISVPGTSAATFDGGAITNTCPGAGIISFEQLNPPTFVFRTVTGGEVSSVPFPTVCGPECKGTCSGTIAGGLVVHSGDSCTLSGANVSGGVHMDGGSLKVCGSAISGGVIVTGGITVSLGFAADDSESCADDTITGGVTITGVTGSGPEGASVEIEGSNISGGVTLKNNGGVELEGNNIFGGLHCRGNVFVTDDGKLNTISGGKDGQCAGL